MRTTLNNVTPRQPNDPGFYGVQTWSAGPIYPAVITVVEVYGTPGYNFKTVGKRVVEESIPGPLLSKVYRLSRPGLPDREFATRDEAEQYALASARAAVAGLPQLPIRWQA